MKPLILVGGGGHCKSVIDVVESAGYEIRGILDKSIPAGETVLRYKVLGNDDSAPLFVEQADFLVTVGQIKSPDIRIRLHKLIEDAGGHFATVIASTAHVSRYATIEPGTVVMHQAVVNAGAHIGKGCIINTFTNIEHDVRIGDYCHVSTGAIINGETKVGGGSFIGSQSVINQCLSICERAVIASGSVVNRDITIPSLYAGNPAKQKR